MRIETPSCRCGCGTLVSVARRGDKRHGHVKGRHFQYVRGHGRRRHFQRYVVDSLTGCWNWNGYVSKNGYGGMIPTPEGYRRPHRVIYSRAKGPIPEGMELDHLCRNRRCVNPDHLEPVTPTENRRRGLATKLTVAAVLEIRRRDSGTSLSSLARRFGVSLSAVIHVVQGKTWKEVAA